jgi:Raf kinase inhibitor-like YbhB/YbcL family protein
MKLWSNSFKDGDRIPGEFAFCVIDPAAHVAMSANRNPHLAWSDLPSGTRSLALICHDYDVPSRADDVNQEGRTVPADLPRVDFFHWVMVDIPAEARSFEAGAFCNGVTPRGKSGPAISGSPWPQARHGLNDYTGWFASDPDMAGEYCGYDGPCPPWNDSLLHHYVFTLYALSVGHVAVEGKFTGPQVREAIKDSILGKASITGVYTLNPAVA